MAGSYTLPQVKVFQEFLQAPNDVTQNLNPFVIGPNYQLIRYSDKGERADCTSAAYTGIALNLIWATGYAGSVVDTDDKYGVTLENAFASFGNSDAPSATCLDAESNRGTKFEFTLTSGKSLVGDDPATLQYGTPIKAGDYLAYKVNSSDAAWSFSKIMSISGGKLSTSSTPNEITATVKDSTGATNSVIQVDLSNYTGEMSGTITLTATAAESSAAPTTLAKMTARSTIPGVKLTTATAIPTTSGTAGDIGKGIRIYAAEAVTAGTYTIDVEVHEPYVRDTVTVADLIPSAPNKFRFVRRFDAVEVDKSFLDSQATDTTSGKACVAVSAGVTTKVGTATLYVLSATAYLTQRNLIQSHFDSVYTVSSDADITANGLGAIHPDNPLAYALHIMLLNCATARIRYIALQTNDAEGYAYALGRASLTTDVYAFCPLTGDKAIIEMVVAHCKTMSSEENKSWRIAFFSMPTARSVDVTPKTASTSLNTDIAEKCTVGGASNKTLTCRPYDGAVTDVSAVANFFDGTVHKGDTVVVYNTAGVKFTTTVASISSPKVIELTDAVSSADSALCDFSIVHTRDDGEYVEAIAATSTGFRHHRAYNVFPNTLRTSDGYTVSGMYGAAAVCALACSVMPQQPITNVEISGFNDLPEVYANLTRDQLNTIASGGTLILMQEKVGGTVYVRHQISTAYSDGNLNTTELSLIKNLDSISYYFANRFAPYIGRYNITDDLMTELEGILKDGLSYLETTTETNRLIGPQVLAEGTEIRALYRDTTEKDKAYASVNLNLPAPFNNFDLHLVVI